MINQIKQLREETGVSVSECKKALEQSKGDKEKAKKILREWGKELAGKKSAREAGKGIIEAYIHPDKRVGALVDLRCETDFVAKSKDFQDLAHELCLQITAMNPLFLTEDDISKKILDEEKKIYKEQMKDSDKPEKVLSQIIEGKLNKFKKEVSLLSQPWIKDDSKIIKQLIEESVAKIGENIIIKRFTRFDI